VRREKSCVPVVVEVLEVLLLLLLLLLEVVGVLEGVGVLEVGVDVLEGVHVVVLVRRERRRNLAVDVVVVLLEQVVSRVVLQLIH